MGASIEGRALRAGVALGARQVAVHGANLLGLFSLARLLGPADYGLVAIALYAQGVVTNLGSLGLGTSLVRARSEPAPRDERTAVGAQLLAAALLGCALWLAAPWLMRLYGRPEGDAALLRAVAATSLFAPLLTVPVARLERRLSFTRLALAEGAQAVAFNALAVALVWRGAGLWGVAAALLARGALGALLLGLACPWRFGVALDRERLRALARFGLPYQAASWIALLKDSLTPGFIGVVAGTAAVGYVGWAQTIATYPTLALMALQRLYVPAFARVQDDRRALGRLVARAMLAANAIAAPLATLTLALIGPLIDLGFGARWRAAQGLFYWLWCANLIVPTITPLLGLLNALGRARAVLALSLVWMLGTWLLGAPLVLWLGPIGFGVANAVVQLSSLWAIALARREVPFAALRSAAPSWGCAAGIGAAVLLAVRLWPPRSLAHLVALGGAALAAYAAALACVLPAEARRAWAALRDAA